MSNESQLATAPVNPGFHKATSMLSATLGIEPRMMIDTVKRQCFPNQQVDSISDAQLAAFISVANSTGLNPLLPGHLYAYPSKNGGIVPVVGPDGVFKMLDERISEGKLDGYACEVFPEDLTQKPTHAIATIWRKGSEHPSKFTAIFAEFVVGSNPNWGTKPRHMIWLRALKQCARQVIHGIPMDEDEVTMAGLKDVTPTVDRPPPPERKPRGSKAVTSEVVVEKEAVKPGDTVETNVGQGTAIQTPPAGPSEDANAPTTPAPAAAGAMPKLTLKDGEKFEGVVTVVDSGAFFISIQGKPTPSVKADVSGDFKGIVIHKAGALEQGGKAVLPPMWEKGSVLKVSLYGFLNMAMRHPSTKDPVTGAVVRGELILGGVLQTYVESAVAVAPQEEMMEG